MLHIIETLDPALGGTSEGVRLLLQYNGEDYSGEAVTLDDPAAPFLHPFAGRVHALGGWEADGAVSRGLLLYRWLKQNCDRYDAFIVNGLWQFTGLATMLALAGRKPYAVYTHGMLDPWFKREYPRKHLKKIPFWYLAEFWVLHRAFRVLFTTTAEASLARKSFALHSWRPAIVPYGVEGPPGPAEAEEAAFLKLCPQLAGKRYLLFLGRMHVKKGCDLLIESFCRVAALDPQLHLVMAGPDQQGLVGALQQVTRDMGFEQRVHWPGMLQGPAKWGAFRLAEAFILPSHQENFGIAVAESLACGTPVLLSREINIAQEIEYDGCGYVEADTLEGTTNLLRRWIGTSTLERQRMRSQAFATFRLRYDPVGNARRVIRLFEPRVQAGRRRTDRHAANRAL